MNTRHLLNCIFFGLAAMFSAATFPVHVSAAKPSVSILQARMYHSAEIKALSGEAWLALIENKDGTELVERKIKVERVHDAVVLKTLGAARPTLIKMLLMEYALLGLATAIFAILAGSLAAWFVISAIMKFQFVILPGVAAGTILAALGFTIVLGLVGTWRILGQKAAPILREL